MEYAIEKYKEANPHTKNKYVVEVFDYVEEGNAIAGCYDTDDAADILLEGYFNMAAYMNHGRLAPLDDIITEEIRADIPESSWQQSKKDRQTLMMPFFPHHIQVYNKQLFRKAGLHKYVKNDMSIQN